MSENPFATDEKLRQLLADVGSIQSGEAFSNWKSSFLKIYRNYLDPDGVLNARDADGRLIKKLQNLAKISLKVESLTQTGHITKAQVTADGRRALGKWTEEMTLVEKAVAQFCPKTTKETDKVGYDKFELGAVLIQDGFQVYDIMLTNRDFNQELREGPLEGVLDKNALSIMDFYAREMQSFVDVMSDLGLFKLMTQCVNVYQEESRPDPSKEPDILTEPVDREEVAVNSSHDKGADDLGKKTEGGKTKIGGKAGTSGKAKKSSAKPSAAQDGKAAPQKENEEKDEEEPPPQEGDGGGGEKIIYFDPKTGNIGLIMRDACTEASDLMFSKDENGEPKNKGVIESKAEKENLVWLLKKLEKKKPKEGAWLEEIKKEKATKKAMGTSKSPSVRVKKDPAPGAPTKPIAKKPVRKLSSTKEVKKGSGFTNPLEQGAPPKRKSSVQDYQGIYNKTAPKPVADGWEKVKPDEAEH